MARVVETASLPPEKAALFFQPWLVVCRGYVAGTSSKRSAREIATAMTRKGF